MNNPSNFNLGYNYAIELYNSIYGKDAKPVNETAAKAKLTEVLKKAIINDKGNDDWKGTFPKLTFEMLNINLHELYMTIDSWLKKHSDLAPSFFTRNI